VVLLNEVDFGCVIEDDKAINTDKLLIISNEDTLSESEYTFLNNKKENSLPVKFSREYENGTFNVLIEAEDVFGNRSSKSLSFIVSNQFKVIRLANFPNPVRGNLTKIVCEFSKIPESAVLRIYSSSGALIKIVPLTPLEDARFFCDLDVSAFANATYFYSVTGKLGNETVKSNIQKMSVLK
ncbi:MAG: hypothetical protein PHW02_08355, partial [bacterium]|nr:hypothetical protein [bacterium]